MAAELEDVWISQLSFAVGGPIKKPEGASFALSGKGALHTQLMMGDEVVVSIEKAGEQVATFAGTVRKLGFVHHRETKERAAYVERAHVIKLDDAGVA